MRIALSPRQDLNGDGETSRDFCYVANAVQANLLAATVEPVIASEARQSMTPHPVCRDFRDGYVPKHRLAEGVVEAMPWYVRRNNE